MKYNAYKYILAAGVFGLSLTSCDDFLDRPTEDSYTTEQYYTTSGECYSGVNYLYNLPWSDLLDSWFSELENAAGNQYSQNNQFALLSIPSDNTSLQKMVRTQWAAIGNANIVYNNIKGGSAPDDAKSATMGECLVWKAVGYFNLVRMLGPIPIVHDNSEDIGNGSYTSKYRVETADAYEYTIMLLEEAMRKLPKSADKGRIDYYSAEALLAKVYLTKAGLGMSGSRNADDLAKAAQYAKDVIDNSGRNLLPVYSDVFRASNNMSEESLIAWHFYGSWNPYGAGNQLQSVFGMNGFSTFFSWGDWTCPSVDLMEAYGVSPIDSPESRTDNDARRKATIMMAGDTYSYFWRDKGGFDYLRFIYDGEYNKNTTGTLSAGTGGNVVKHLVGNSYDHEAELGYPDTNQQATGLSEHYLRLADVYLIYAEAMIGNAGSTSDASAIDAFYAVRSRSVTNYNRPASISFEDVWKERRLELAYEGDRWFDYVRLSYYNPDRALNELVNMKRSYWNNLDELYKGYYDGNGWNVTSSMTYDQNPPKISPSSKVFQFPMPEVDVVYNPNLSADPIHVDVRSEYSF